MALYFTTFPKVKGFIEQSRKFAVLNQMSLSLIGQRKRQYGSYPCFKSTAAYNGTLRNSQNYLIQGPTSTIGLVTFAEVNRRIKKFGAISTCSVYDSQEIQCPVDKIAEVIDTCFDCLNNFPQEAFPFIQLPIGCEAEAGTDWGTCRAVRPGTSQQELELILKNAYESNLNYFGAPI